jgi:hypothetical protein
MVPVIDAASGEPQLGLHAKTAFILLHTLRSAQDSNSARLFRAGSSRSTAGGLAAISGREVIVPRGLIGVGAKFKMESAAAAW